VHFSLFCPPHRGCYSPPAASLSPSTALQLPEPTMMQAADTDHTTDSANSSDEAAAEDTLSISSLLRSPTPAAPSTAPTTSDAADRQHRSPAWPHFEKAEDYDTSKKVICRHCRKSLLATSGSTTSMLGHLKKRHPDALGTARPPDR
jgi:hypothetical protein